MFNDNEIQIPVDKREKLEAILLQRAKVDNRNEENKMILGC